ncbi:MAG: hypothetical protein RL093_1577 [Pseudomonadota bacterium]
MIVTLVLIALLQDGPIRTAPEPSPQESATSPADPGPACTFGGRTVSSPGCPPPRGRIAFDAAPPQAPAGTADEDDNPRAGLNRSALGQAAVGEGGYSRGAAAVPESGVPGWALLDPARWETSQCGTAGDDACRRQARNRLAMARAGLATEAPSAGSAAAPDNCRMVMRRSETGFGGSLSRVCGDVAEVEASLDRLEGALRPAVEPCDRPASLESQDAWIARCRALPQR